MQKTLTGYSWFLVLCSWEPGDDDEAVKRFGAVYDYLLPLTDVKLLEEFKKNNPNDPLCDLDPDSFKALNLIGRRQFVMVGQAKSNRLQQKLALDIGLRTGVSVEVLPATLVHDLRGVLI